MLIYFQLLLLVVSYILFTVYYLLFTVVVVARERKRRQVVEKKLSRLERTAQKMVQHYDSCFVDLAKQVRRWGLNQPPLPHSTHTHTSKAGSMILTHKLRQLCANVLEALPGHILSRLSTPQVVECDL